MSSAAHKAPRFGRLFWKFFLLISLVQILSLLAISAWISAEHRREHRQAVDNRPLNWSRPPGAPGMPGSAPWDNNRVMPAPPERGFVPPPAGAAPGPFPHPPDDAGAPRGLVGWPFLGIPPEPLLGGALASLASAALLAWVLAKPIRVLHAGFEAAAGGDLDVRVTERMGSGQDEIRDLGRGFDQMAERLQALIGAQRRLLHDVSHEMRSPLARIQAAIGLAGQQPGQEAVALARIERESVRMDRLIGELLALARLQAGFVREPEEDIDVRELVAVIVDDARFEARTKGRRLEARLSEGEAMVRGNPELLRRAIENVVRNAIKYSYEGGEVIVELRPGPGGRSVLVAIQDSGPGVPDPDLEAIFEPFFRGTGAEGKDGHGLGLAIAKRVVSMHGGTISAANLLRGGLRVQIELPLTPAAIAG